SSPSGSPREAACWRSADKVQEPDVARRGLSQLERPRSYWWPIYLAESRHVSDPRALAAPSADKVWPIALRDVENARARLSAHLSPTPVREYPVLNEVVGRGIRVFVKHENHQPTNSFKVRNGLAAVSALSCEQRTRGIVAASRGNYGLALAYAGAAFRTAVTVCVPEGNNPDKNA